MVTIALTGGIGSGKSTALNLFKKCGCAIISMDAISKKLSEPGQEAYDEIVTAFGKDILCSDSNIDRTKLATLIFDDPQARKSLEQLLHPRIEHAVRDELHKIRGTIAVIEIPLLISRKQFDFIDRVLVIESEPKIRMERVLKRDNNRNREDIEAIINSQINDEQRKQMADDILINNGSLQTLEAAIENLYKTYQQVP